MTWSLDRPAAVRSYALALRWVARGRSASRRADMLQTFRDATADCPTPGALWRLTFAELWNLVGDPWRRRGAASRLTATGSARPAGRGPGGSAAAARQAVRALRARPAELTLVVGLLAVGLAAASTIFGVVDAVVLQPMPFAQVDRLVQVWGAMRKNLLTPAIPYELAVRWLDRRDLFAAGGLDRMTTALVSDRGAPELVQADLVSPGLFETLGVHAALGRTFMAAEGQAGSDHVVILSDATWRARFGGSVDALGQTLTINGAPYTVVGVMPVQFRFPYERQRLWMPLSLTAPPGAGAFVTVTGRLGAGVSVAAATQAIEAAGPAMAAQARRPWKDGATLVPFKRQVIDAAAGRSLTLLFAATALLVVMVGLNVANLGMAKVFVRARDAAIRSALGASRRRLLGEALLEQLLVGGLALLVAVPLTVGGLDVAQSLLPARFTFASLHVIALDARVLALMAALAFATPIGAGLAPALVASGPTIVSALRLDGRSIAGTPRSRRLRDGLVVAEVACAVVLLVTAALLGRSFLRLQASDLGFDSRNLISVNLEFPTAAFPTALARDLYVDRVADALAHRPGILGATPATGVPPIHGGIGVGTVVGEGQDSGETDALISQYGVRPEFFALLRIPLTAGRSFSADEDPHHVVVSASLAAHLWAGANPLGRRFHWTDEPTEWYTVTGVAGPVREDYEGAEATQQVYTPLPRATVSSPGPARAGSADPISGQIRFAIRVADPGTAMPEIRRTLAAANPAVVIQTLEPVDDELAHRLDGPRFLLALMLVFGATGLLLSAAGVYGVLSCLVTQQMREVGVRLMLGAEPRAIARRIVRDGLSTVTLGLAIGILAAVGAGRLVGSVLFEVQTADLRSYALVVVVILMAGGLAAWGPAARARRADPLALLRHG
jgi:putative ABC transport system permease protein